MAGCGTAVDTPSLLLAFQLAQKTAHIAVHVGIALTQVLDQAHRKRNLAEYEGYLEKDERLLADTLAATRALIASLFESEGMS